MARNQNKIVFVLLISFNTLYGVIASATTTALPPLCLTWQTADYVYQSRIYRPSPPRPIWTGWRHEGACRTNCKVDRWSGHVYCCKRVCR